ncbi:hypothetical protein CCB80_14840 [Armatimonadetes bacterium Uphvl-Ar1]|nr:hypothetical protein CCB80_14840 [Armatimonadetes bacterium Uphvl-Ar1]
MTGGWCGGKGFLSQNFNGVKMSEAIAKNTVDAEALVLKYLADPRPDLKDLIIVHYAGMVERIARRYAGTEPLDDLAQVGYIGLLNALSKFDASVGVQFNTYATHLIAGEIKHYLRDRAQTIRHPAWLQELRHKVNKATQALQGELQRVPTEREIAERVGISEASVQEVLASLETVKLASLDVSPGDDGEGDSDLDKLDAALSSIEQVSVEDRVLLESAMEQLRDLEREVLCLFHFDALNQTEIANRLGISCNYVSHILRQSLSKLRKILSQDEKDERSLRAVGSDERTVLDSEIGIYDEDYFRTRLSEEAHRAVSTEGTVSVVLVEIDGLHALKGFYGEDTVRDFLIDTAAF